MPHETADDPSAGALQRAAQQAYSEGYRVGKQEEAENANRNQVALLETQVEKLCMELRAQGASQGVRTYGGENSNKFHDWLNDMTRLRAQLSADDSRTRTLCLQTLTGPAAEYCTRLVSENHDITWSQLRKALSDRYNDMADTQYARQALRRRVQKNGESVQNYFENLLTTARNAYTEEDLGDRFVQAQLTEIFTDGLRDDKIARRLIRAKPKTMDRALKIAAEEQQTSRAFNLRRGPERSEEPMDIDIGDKAATPITLANDEVVKLLRNLEIIADRIAHTLEENGRPTNPRANRPPRTYGPPRDTTNAPQGHRWTQDGRPICSSCKRPGHYRRDCSTGPSKNS